MEYTLSQAETILLAKSMIVKGKPEFFVRETLKKRGANPEHIELIMSEMAVEKSNNGKKQKVMIVVAMAIVTILGYLILPMFSKGV